jgi:prepilin-type N-terminal cleavage/methylation domain-containing protein
MKSFLKNKKIFLKAGFIPLEISSNKSDFLKVFSTRKKSKFLTGFTLIELLVTLAIFAVTTTIVMFSQGKFDNSVLLSNLAYDMALTIRQAQTFGVNVKEFVSASNKSSFAPYGVYFSAGDPTHYVMFTDTTNNLKYDSKDMTCLNTDVECVNKYALKNGDHITLICAGSSETSCSLPSSTSGGLTILFKRPEPDAKIFLDDATAITPLPTYAKITISSADGSSQKSIVVTGTGQIYVK